MQMILMVKTRKMSEERRVWMYFNVNISYKSI